jgi:hypothetical protein
MITPFSTSDIPPGVGDYFGALDATQESLISALVLLIFISMILKILLQTKRLSKKKTVDDPFQLVINQPVRRIGRCENTPVKKVEKIKQINRPAKQLKIPPIKPDVREQSKDMIPQSPEILCAVAEIDFISSATSEDILSLKDRFGFILVASDTYPQVVAALKTKRHDFLDVFMPAPQVDAKMAYQSVALAKRLKAVVLSDSENVKRVCTKHGIPCWSLSGWRMRMSQTF